MTSSHTTIDEINFLRHLGTWTNNSPSKVEDVPWKSRAEKLFRYRNSMENRERWGAINPVLVRQFINSEIERLSA
jgi:hypothetical protein